jgi:HTH-type transcriptional regulator/antitoxin MqsA
MNASCPVCGEGHLVRETRTESFEYQGAALSADLTEEYCDSCGTLALTPAVIRENARNIQRAKNAHDKLLSGEEICAFRDKYKITQRLAAQLFGGGPTAFAKYEANEISHNASMDRLLRLCLSTPLNILHLAEITQSDLLPETLIAIRACMVEIIDDNVNARRWIGALARVGKAANHHLYNTGEGEVVSLSDHALNIEKMAA